MRSTLTSGEVSALSYCGTSSIRFGHLKSHSVGQGARHKGLYGELLIGHYAHYHSYRHNLGRYNYLFLARHSQRLDIQGFGNPAALRVSAPPSSLGAARLAHVLGWLCQLSRKPLLIWGLAVVLWAYLSKRQQSWLASLVSRALPKLSAYLYDLRQSWLSHLVAWRDYLSCSLKLNQVVYPYLILPQTRVGCKP